MEHTLQTPNEIKNKLAKILLRVQKPGRYTGGEFNQIIKDWNSTAIHCALVFPDIYDIGLPNLGLAILYDEINKRNDSLAERAYSPWVDMEAFMRQERIPAYSLESKHALSDFDIVGITLPYETLYTNTLNILDLAGIPLFSKERNKSHPFIIAGGNSTYNPEPMSAFIDAFVIGDGEQIIHSILDKYRDWKIFSNSRIQFLENISSLNGVYIPQFYDVEYHQSGIISKIYAIKEGISFPIKKALVKVLPPSPTNFIVPNIDIDHNRISIEIMRGCTRGCRFCQAGMINRPIRERSVEEIIDSAKKSLIITGFDEISLLSLSSSDYTKISELIDAIKLEFSNQQVSISLPSLRIETFSLDLMEKLLGSRHGSFTFAPEAASESMKNKINKIISSDKLIKTAENVYKRGWPTIKLYFMIGFPGETDEDIKSIVNLCREVITIGKTEIGHRAKLNVSINTFIPKPHTPFQWMPLEKEIYLVEKYKYFKNNLRSSGININWSDQNSSKLEAILTRGDRKLNRVIFDAWKSGAKFDAWHDQLKFEIWEEAFENNHLTPDFYLFRERSLSEILPWDHITSGVSKLFLTRDLKLSQKGLIREDCRENCHGCGIQQYFEGECKTKNIDRNRTK